MAFVIGPNGVLNEVPDEMASCLVGAGDRGYEHAQDEPQAKPATRRVARKTTEK